MYRGIPNQDITQTKLQGHVLITCMTLCNMLSLYHRYLHFAHNELNGQHHIPDLGVGSVAGE